MDLRPRLERPAGCPVHTASCGPVAVGGRPAISGSTVLASFGCGTRTLVFLANTGRHGWAGWRWCTQMIGQSCDFIAPVNAAEANAILTTLPWNGTRNQGGSPMRQRSRP